MADHISEVFSTTTVRSSVSEVREREQRDGVAVPACRVSRPLAFGEPGLESWGSVPSRVRNRAAFDAPRTIGGRREPSIRFGLLPDLSLTSARSGAVEPRWLLTRPTLTAARVSGCRREALRAVQVRRLLQGNSGVRRSFPRCELAPGSGAGGSTVPFQSRPRRRLRLSARHNGAEVHAAAAPATLPAPRTALMPFMSGQTSTRRRRQQVYVMV